MSEFGADPTGAFAQLRNAADAELAYRALTRAVVTLCISKAVFTQAEYQAALDAAAAQILTSRKGGT